MMTATLMVGKYTKEQVKNAKIWILDSTSLMKALNVLIEIPA